MICVQSVGHGNDSLWLGCDCEMKRNWKLVRVFEFGNRVHAPYDRKSIANV